jgi:hypothetical protein
MKSSATAQLSSESRLLLDAYKNMMNVSDPITLTPVLNDNFLSILSSKIVESKTSEEKQLCLLSLNILGWILSCVSCSDCVDEAVSFSQKNFIHSNVRIQSCFSNVIALMNEDKQHVDVMNLCLFVVMEQCTPDLLRGHLSIIVHAITRSIGITGIHAFRNQPFEEQSWKQPIIACSALCTLLEQMPDEVLSRHAVWAADVFLLLVHSFSDDSSHTNLSCSSNTSKTGTMNPALAESKAGDFSPSSYCADADSRLLPLAVSATRLLNSLPVEMLVPLLPIALSSYEAAIQHIWCVCTASSQPCLVSHPFLLFLLSEWLH